MKLIAPVCCVILLLVAPFTGAWIETSRLEKQFASCKVAPFTGAWIETHSLTVLHAH